MHTAILLGPDDETLATIALAARHDTVKWTQCPRITAGRQGEAVAIRPRVVDLTLDRTESELWSIIAGESVAVYRWPRIA